MATLDVGTVSANLKRALGELELVPEIKRCLRDAIRVTSDTKRQGVATHGAGSLRASLPHASLIQYTEIYCAISVQMSRPRSKSRERSVRVIMMNRRGKRRKRRGGRGRGR
ncbi:hypothetical protein BC939DRAFT_282725 [Gamsiella multidivaricata]|uniref:uncharacterized protein n=1 Tax=Gamsiella multidivaricata TaxID=101098 RepID=UPI00221E8D2B|nr:uncharacterized protein BC939DRAFT_282725 [Gamsiella multidivaricata]KAI7830466.1 hypothetical protein BC939DRAFT_282725 [Gamsiella multidivaricata]